MNHKGYILNHFKTINGKPCKLEFSVSMASNPDFTANIMVAYINAVINLKKYKISGTFTPLDIPVSFLYKENQKDKLLKDIC